MERKYPNRADKNVSLFLFLVGGVAITMTFVVTIVLAINDFDSRYILYVAFGTLLAIFVPFSLLVLCLTSPKKNAIRGKKIYDYEIDHIKRRYHDFNYYDDVEGIEHLVVSPYGVYAISSRSYEGRIYGMESDVNWRQSFAFQKQKVGLTNPCKEYLEVIENFKKKYRVEFDIKPVLVLLSNNRGYINSKTLYAPRELATLINTRDGETLSSKDIHSLIEKLDK